MFEKSNIVQLAFNKSFDGTELLVMAYKVITKKENTAFYFSHFAQSNLFSRIVILLIYRLFFFTHILLKNYNLYAIEREKHLCPLLIYFEFCHFSSGMVSCIYLSGPFTVSYHQYLQSLVLCD